jgi:uroporphyrinogen decarboxylase
MLRAIEFSGPDRIPLFYHKSGAGLFRHGRKLQDLFRRYPPDNAVSFDVIPTPAPGTIRPDGSYLLRTTDEWGTVWEDRVIGLQGQPCEHPIHSLDEIERYKLPAPPACSGPAFEAERAAVRQLKNDYLVFDGWILLFERLQELMPAEEAFVNIGLEERPFLDLLDRITEYNMQAVRSMLTKGADVIFFGDDWASQQGPIISPDQFRRLFRPRLQPLFDAIRAAGAKVLIHCCGQMGALFDEFVEMRFDCIWHQVNRYEAQEFADRCRRRKVAAFIHPDRQDLIPRGTPDQIRRYIRRYADIYHRLNGGGVFYVEIENDAPFENAEALITAVNEFG